MRKRRLSPVASAWQRVTKLESPKNPRTWLLLYRTCRKTWSTRAVNLRRISRDLATMLFVCSSCFHVSSGLIPQVIGFQSKACCFVLNLPCNGSIWRASAGAAGGTLRSQPDPSPNTPRDQIGRKEPLLPPCHQRRIAARNANWDIMSSEPMHWMIFGQLVMLVQYYADAQICMDLEIWDLEAFSVRFVWTARNPKLACSGLNSVLFGFAALSFAHQNATCSKRHRATHAQ